MGWGKDHPHTSGKSFWRVMCFPESDTSLFANKTSQHLGHTKGICSCGLLGFISQQSFSHCLEGMFATSLSENAICIPRSTHHSSQHKRSPFSFCLFSPVPPLHRKQKNHHHVLQHVCSTLAGTSANLNTKVWATTSFG